MEKQENELWKMEKRKLFLKIEKKKFILENGKTRKLTLENGENEV